ncbi:hypothetical protein BDR03DRAFT_1075385, partial [Suillus americanus]
ESREVLWLLARKSAAYFKDIALDVLWAELENLEPLFTCLPQDLRTKTSDQIMPVTTQDWLIFEQYAAWSKLLVPNLQALLSTMSSWSPFMHVLSPGPYPRQAFTTISLPTTPPQVTELGLSWLSQLRTHISDLDKLVIRSLIPLTLARETVEGWVVRCRSLELWFWKLETALVVGSILRKLDDLRSSALGWSGVYQPKTSDDVANAFSLKFQYIRSPHALPRYWPRLRYFDLGIQNFWQTQPKITLHGLTTILSRIDEAWSGIRRYEYKSTYD